MLKSFTYLMLILLLTSVIYAPVNASSQTEILINNTGVMPFWSMIRQVSNHIDINSGGKAVMVSQISAYSGQVDSIRISAYLERYENGSWVAIGVWTQDYEGISALWSRSLYVNKGYYYRLTTYFHVYGDGSQESTILISGVKYY